MRRLILAVSACFLASSAAAQAPAPPKLLIAISVDQLSADLWDEYRPQFTGGFARLAQGTVFRNGYQSHAATETCPGHSTILTGIRPARSGIVMNNWVDQSAGRTDKSIYCAEDETATAPPGSPQPYVVSARHLQVPSLGDLMKTRWSGSRSVAVAGKDRAAVMMGGHNPDQRWFFAGKGFVTDLAGRSTPKSVSAINGVVQQALAAPREPLEAPPVCAAKAATFPIALGKRTVGNGRFDRQAGDVRAFRASPEYDGAVLALSAALIREMQLGRGDSPDLIAVGLSATDYVGHTFGTNGQEMCLQLLDLDRELGAFFAMLDASGIDYAVALTADHGGLDIPARVAGGSYVDEALGAAQLGKRIGAELKLTGPILFGDYAGDIYIDRALSPTQRTLVRAAAIAAYRASPQVEDVFTRDEIAQTTMPSGPPDRWTLTERLRASFDPARSGDLLVVLKPKIAPYPATEDLASTHGTPWDYDRRVPIIFWRRGAPGTLREEAIETIDIMPTLAAMLELRTVAPSVDGNCLHAVPGVICDAR